MTVRVSNENDIHQILVWARAFHSYSPYRDTGFDDQAVTALIQHVMANGVIFQTDNGFIAGHLVSLPFNPSVKFGSEIAWWCPSGGDGQALKTAFDEWVKDSGGQAVQYSILNDERAGHMNQLLVNDGFKPIEVAYIKGVS